MKRRSLLKGAAAIGVLDWLGFFRRFGVPGTAKTLGIADAVAQTMEPRFLVMWFQEGGWDSYSMFSPIETPNHATMTIPAGTLNPNPAWSSQFYRAKGYGADAAHFATKTTGNITYGYLAADGEELMPDLAVVSSHQGNTFHSGGRWDYHYGKYAQYASLTAQRQPNERSLMQAFAEVYGSAYPLANVSWHRWLSDGELEEANYPEGTGFYEKLGPAYAHTIYGRTPSEMRNRLSQLGNVTAGARSARIRAFVDDLHQNFIADHNGESVAAFSSAVNIYKQLTSGTGIVVNPATLFTDPTLRSEFNVATADEATNSTSVNGNPARSKDSPMVNVQAMMAYELMTKGLSLAFWIENRQIRGFDTHDSRTSIFNRQGQVDQLTMMRRDLWTPLKTFVRKLKSTQFGTSGKSYWDLTTIVLASEMGRTIQGDVASILASADADSVKYTKIMEQDCCQHWKTNSVAFLGGNVQGNRQYGRVGTTTVDSIPLRADGTLDPAYNPATGVLQGTKDPNSFVPNAGHVYATALELTGINPTGKGRNVMPALSFIKKP
ncbi:MAG: DUF1501 domain-containing protein [Myxococcota bacterium]